MATWVRWNRTDSYVSVMLLHDGVEQGHVLLLLASDMVKQAIEAALAWC